MDKNYKEYNLGIDIGSGRIKVCYFNKSKNIPEIYDFSEGLGEPSIASVSATRDGEFIIGDLAVTTLGPLVKDIGSSPQSLEICIDDIISEIITRENNVRVKHITFAISENTKLDILNEALQTLKIPKNLTSFKTSNDCILNFHFSKKKEASKNLLVIDYGADALRISYFTKKEKGIYVKEGSYLDKELGMNNLEKELNELFLSVYEKHLGRTLDVYDIYGVRAFTHENKNKVLRTPKRQKLIFNFGEVFEYKFSPNTLVDSYMQKFESHLKKFVSWQGLDTSNVEEILLVGGGFNMYWPEDIVEIIFPDSNIAMYKKPEFSISLGASLIGSKQDPEKIVRTEKPQIKYNIGILTFAGEKEVFYPVIDAGEINAGQTYAVRVMADLTGPFKLDIYKDSVEGKAEVLHTINITNINKPKYAGALEVCLNISNNILTIKVFDISFEAPKGVIATETVFLN